MKRSFFAACVAASVVISCNNEKTAGETNDPATDSTATVKTSADKNWVPIDSAAEMRVWTEIATPGRSHEVLAQSNGKWNGEATLWMSDGGESFKTKTSTENRMVMGGRYQVSNNKGDFMGMPFEGMSLTGYHNFKKKFVSSWIDNMGTGVLNMEGTYDSTSKAITFTGKMINPANGIECDMKEVYRILDNNTQVMEMYGPDRQTGKQYKTMEIRLTRDN